MIISIYMDITDALTWSPTLTKAIQASRKRKIPILICADTNSHSSLWGSEVSNTRGEHIEDMLYRHNLVVQNVGAHYTYFCKNAQTIIDVTLTSSDLNGCISNWTVNSLPRGSDHLMISFNITISIDRNIVARNFRKGDFACFQKIMETKDRFIPDIWSVEQLEMSSKLFQEDVENALQQTHPKHKVSVKMPTYEWWDEDLRKQKKAVNSAFSKYRRNRDEDSHHTLIRERREFTRLLKVCKRRSWKKFLADASEPQGVARINKIIQKQTTHTLGLMKRADGSVALDPGDSMDVLLDTHLPGSCSIRHRQAEVSHDAKCKINHPEAAFFTSDKIAVAIKSFGDFKAAGTDGIPPCVLKNLGPIALNRLRCMFQASYLLGYVPTCWREARIIFIPKMGKTDYSQPRSFRPITLSSFVMKTMERVVLWHLNDTTLKENPLSKNQHAFRRGHSTESALSNMVEQIEHALARDKFALGVFLDIQGAFDNVQPHYISDAMRLKKLSETLIRWYSHYLRYRQVRLDYNGIQRKRYLTRGTPQGGVLSPVMWNIAFDSLLDMFKEGWVSICGFADDAGLLTVGTNLAVLRSRMQSAVNKAITWGKEAGLAFSPPKTVAVLFTTKYKYTLPAPLTVSGVEIAYSKQVRYLGVILDQKLTWHQHIDSKIKEAKQKLLRVRNATGKLWGFPPIMGRWLYLSVVRPALTYGALVWSRVCRFEGVRRQLERLNRLALLTLGHFRRSTPTAGLEVLSYIPPLDISIKGEAAMGAYRTREHQIWPTNKTSGTVKSKEGHRKTCQTYLNALEIGELGEDDKISPEHFWDNQFSSPTGGSKSASFFYIMWHTFSVELVSGEWPDLYHFILCTIKLLGSYT